MKCEEFRNIVFELASGELDGEAAKAAADHMADCQECRRDYEDTLALTAALRELKEEEAPAGLADKVMGRISAEKRRRHMNTFIRFGTAAAAAVVLVVGAVNVLPDIEKKPVQDDTTVNQAIDAEDEDVNDENAKYKFRTYVMDDADQEEAVVTDDSDAGEAEVTTNDYKADYNKPLTNGSAGKTESGSSSGAAKKSLPMAMPDDAVKEDSAEDDVMVMSLNDKAPPGDSGEETEAYLNDSFSRIVTAGAGGGAKEHSFIRRRCEFIVAAEFAEAAASVDPKGKSMEKVSAELSAQGAEYEVYIIDDDYTEEYETADPQRRAEIEALCETDECSITVK